MRAGTLNQEADQAATGVAIGMGMVPLEVISEAALTFQTKGYSKVSPFFVPKILVNMPAGQVSIRHKLKAPTTRSPRPAPPGLTRWTRSEFASPAEMRAVMVAGDGLLHQPLVPCWVRQSPGSEAQADPKSACRPFTPEGRVCHGRRARPCWSWKNTGMRSAEGPGLRRDCGLRTLRGCWPHNRPRPWRRRCLQVKTARVRTFLQLRLLESQLRGNGSIWL